jgi:mycofactocin glycosyltransferase
VTPLPEGFGLTLDRSVRSFREGTVLVGGHPGRLIALSRAGAEALRRWLDGATPSAATRQLGRRLVDAGMAHPVPPPQALEGAPPVTVVIPVRNRTASLEQCLEALGDPGPVVVVDDASDDPAAVAEACRRHGATVIHRSVNGGPGAARNQAVPAITTELVAFVDSDCRVRPEWLDALTPMFADPRLGAVAPRVRPRSAATSTRSSVLARYSAGRSALDMGPESSEVGAGRVVGYVPTAALVARVGALAGGFDERLRVGEDVDLVWRLCQAGWRVRYEASVTVHHDEPTSWAKLLARRFRYGTSAGPLARRHPGRLAPLELRPWPTAVTTALVAGHPVIAIALLAGSTGATARPLRRYGVPVSTALWWSVQGVAWTVVGVGRALTVLVAPAVVIGALRSRRRAAVAVLLVTVPPLVEWWRRRPALDPVRWTVAAVADDVAYGAGVWVGAVRARSLGPLLPALRLPRTDASDPRGPR